MRTNLKRVMAVLLALVMILGMIPVTALAEEAKDTVILYTNDVHTYINKSLSYDNIAAMKQELAKENDVLLFDAGDEIQGSAYGSMDKGKTIIDLMNASGYDLATLGNHEFDYGMDGCENAVRWAKFPYVSCNFYYETNGVKGENVLDSYKIFDTEEYRIAVIGITTPESFTKSTPAYFQDEDGNYIYGIAGGTDGKDLYKAVQDAIDAVVYEFQPDFTIALGHLGVDPNSAPWTSEDVIANTVGLDAFIDGHSHSTIPGQIVKDLKGNDVVLTSTGSYFDAIGKMTIHDGKITTELVTEYAGSDAKVAEMVDTWMNKVDSELGTVIGHADVTFDNYDTDGKRLVRSAETNTGDFAADALYYLFDNMDLKPDVAFMNGGGVRNKAITGDLTYKSCKDIHTFGNVACLQEVTGQQILDALEWGARDVGNGECGGFLQVSGLTYDIYMNVPKSVQMDAKEVWIGGPTGEYRVRNVRIYDRESDSYLPLDLNKTYRLAGYNYTLRDLGDGFAMFDGAVNVVDYVMQDYMVLANYIQAFDVDEDTGLPTIEDWYCGPYRVDYTSVTGEGRIVALPYVDTNPGAYYEDAISEMYWWGVMTGTSENTFSPGKEINRAELITALYRSVGEPDVSEIPLPAFPDVQDGQYYSNALRFAVANGIVNGYPDGTFKPGQSITREEMATMIYRMADFLLKRFTKLEDIELVARNEDAKNAVDWAIVSPYAQDALIWCVSYGVIKGITLDCLTLAPGATANRAEAAQIICNLSNALYDAMNDAIGAAYPIDPNGLLELPLFQMAG